jgi:5-methylcytosine-specific restriction endonuclease McrA
MKIFSETKELVRKEKEYTKKILKNLMIIERDKLFCDLKYPSLYKYLIKELGYTDAEAMIRVNAVRLMLKSKVAQKNVEEDRLSLSNAAEANKAIKKSVDRSPEKVEQIVQKATESSARVFKDFVRKEIEKRREEIVRLDEHMLEKLDRIRKKFNDDTLSTYELMQILIEKELKDPNQAKRKISKAGVKISKSKSVKLGEMRSGQLAKKQSRYISKAVKREVFDGQCHNCGNRYNLEYDHRLKFSHGGSARAENIQLLCRACNQRKEIITRQMNLFA